MITNIKCLDYESEATEDWVCSGMMPVVGRKKKHISYISISLLSVLVFPTINAFLEGDRAGSWWKPFIFLDEAGFNPAKRWRRGWERPRTMFAGGPDHTPLNVILRGPHSKISAKGPEFLATALRAIMVSGPSTVYHLAFTPILPFPYCNPTEEFFSTWRWKVFNRLLTNKSLFSRP